ncbi:histidine ammonia-lyase, partial [bacterium M00.F.Ca.ET.191.01.1.1]
VFSQAHPVAPMLGQTADGLTIALAQVAAMSERRIDRLVNPLVNNLPAFLAAEGGCNSGFMIAQYTATSPSNVNRRLAAPAATDGGVTSGLQEDFLA